MATSTPNILDFISFTDVCEVNSNGGELKQGLKISVNPVAMPFDKTNDMKLRMAIALVLDISSSMSCVYKNLVDAAEYVLDELTSDCYVSIIVFNHAARSITNGFVPATASNVSTIKRELSEVVVEGSTNIGDAVLLARTEFSKIQQLCMKNGLIANMVLITDGISNTGPKLHQVRDVIQNHMIDPSLLRFAINTYSLGFEIDPRELILLSNASAGGKYHKAEKNIEGIGKSFASISSLKKAVAANITIRLKYHECIVKKVHSSWLYALSSNKKILDIYVGPLVYGEERSFLVNLAFDDTVNPIYIRDNRENQENNHFYCEGLMHYGLIGEDKEMIKPLNCYIRRPPRGTELSDPATNSEEMLILELRIRGKEAIDIAIKHQEKNDYENARKTLTTTINDLKQTHDTGSHQIKKYLDALEEDLSNLVKDIEGDDSKFRTTIYSASTALGKQTHTGYSDMYITNSEKQEQLNISTKIQRATE